MTTLDSFDAINKAFNLAPADAQEVLVATARNQEWLSNHLTRKAVQNSVMELIKRMRTVKDAEFKVKFTKDDDQVTVVISDYSKDPLDGNKYIRLALDGASTNAKFWHAEFVMAELLDDYIKSNGQSGVCVGLNKVNDVISEFVNKKDDAVVEVNAVVETNAAVKTKKVGK